MKRVQAGLEQLEQVVKDDEGSKGGQTHLGGLGIRVHHMHQPLAALLDPLPQVGHL